MSTSSIAQLFDFLTFEIHPLAIVSGGGKELVGVKVKGIMESMGIYDMYQLHISCLILHRFRWNTWVMGYMGDAAHG